MAVLPVQTVPKNTEIDTVVMTAADAGLSDTFQNDGKTVIILGNSNAATRTVTVSSVNCSHGRVGNLTVLVPADAAGTNGIAFLPPLARTLFTDASGDVTLTTSANAGLTYGVLSLAASV